MKWFGPAAFSNACVHGERAPVPVGQHCAWCEEGFAPGDVGYLVPLVGDTITDMAYHAECFLRTVLGGVNHHKGLCTCCGGDEEPDPSGMTKREAARAAADAFNEKRHG
jgi:hypothetical protein